MTDDDSTEVTVTRGTLRRWAGQLDNADDRIGHARIVASAIRSVLNVDDWPRRIPVRPTYRASGPGSPIPADTSPDPEGAEATVHAPNPRTAEETEP